MPRFYRSLDFEQLWRELTSSASNRRAMRRAIAK